MKVFIKKSIIFLSLSYVTIFALINTDVIKSEILNSIDKCLTTVIPSLFAMMIISSLIIKSRILNPVAQLVNVITEKFGMNGDIFTILLLSTFAGYPVGSKLILDEFKSGSITKKQAELYIGVCFGAGPSFVIGCVANILFEGSNAGLIIIISTVSVNVIIAILISMLNKKSNKNKCKSSLHRINFSSDILVEASVSAGKNMLNICLMVIVFSIVSVILKSLGIINFIADTLSKFLNLNIKSCEVLVNSVLDVTNLNCLEVNNYLYLPFVCGLISFGGICVILQIKAIVGKNVRMYYFIILRIVCAVLSGIVCRIIAPILLKFPIIETVKMTSAKIYSSNSMIPSIMLIIMIVILLIDFSRLRLYKKQIHNEITFKND